MTPRLHPPRPDRLEPGGPHPGLQRHPPQRHRPRAGPRGRTDAGRLDVGCDRQLAAVACARDRPDRGRRPRPAAGPRLPGAGRSATTGRSRARRRRRAWSEFPARDYPGAEPLDDVVERCLRGLEKIDADYPDQNVVVVCHGTIMKYTLIRLTGHPIDVHRERHGVGDRARRRRLAGADRQRRARRRGAV